MRGGELLRECDDTLVRGVKSLERVGERGRAWAATAGDGGAGPGSVAMTSSSGGNRPGLLGLEAAAPPVGCLVGLDSELARQVARLAVSVGKSSGGLVLSAARFRELVSEAIAFMLAIKEFRLELVCSLLKAPPGLAEGVSMGESLGESKMGVASSARRVSGAGRGRRWTGGDTT